jgi:hypothetical protein
MAELPQGTLTFVFTDIEGSTRLFTSRLPLRDRACGSPRSLSRAAKPDHRACVRPGPRWADQPFTIRAGDVITAADWAPAESRTFRISEASY